MSDPAFGLKAEVDEQLNKVMTAGKAYSAADGRSLRMQFYDEHFKIKDYSEGGSVGEHPFGIILMASAEDYISGGPRELMMRDYLTYKIKDHFGLSWLDYLEMEPAEVESMKKLCVKQIATNQNDIDDANSAIKAAQRQINAASK